MKKKLNTIILLFFFLVLYSGFSQEISVTGNIISSADNGPLPGVSIVVKGTTDGTQTDFDGNYSIDVAPDATLVFSYIGYATQEIAVNGQTEIDIVLNESAQGLEEVVVLGYSSQKKTTLTASVSSVQGVELAEVPVPSVASTLGGRVSGLITNQGSGEPGFDETTFRVRGVGTPNNPNALVMVDGIERDITPLNSRDIETITVLKDAASVAPYGLRGANGVVLVTTKRGREGKMTINLNTSYGMQTPTVLPKIADSFTWASLKNQAFINDGGAPANVPFSQEALSNYQNGTGDPNRFADSNILDILIGAAPLQNHGLSISGGDEKFKYYASLNFVDQAANWGRATNFQRYNITSNVDYQISERTKVGIDVLASLQDSKSPSVGAGLDPVTQQAVSGAGGGGGILRNLYRLNSTNPIFLNGDRSTPAGYFERNPYLDINESGFFDQSDYRTALTIRFEHKLKAIDGLALRANLAIDKRDVDTKIWRTPYTFYQLNDDDSLSSFLGNVSAPSLTEAAGSSRQITLQLIANYNKTWGKHNVDGLFVFEPRDGTTNPSILNKFISATKNNFATDVNELSTSGNSNPADLVATGFSTEQRQVGYAIRGTYIYDSKYILEFGGRYDGHYFFAPDNRFTFFPSASAAWRVSEESFFNSNFINNLKLRGSWGKSGALAGEPFQYLSQFNLRDNIFAFNSGAVAGAQESLDPNPNITWEKATKTNIGIEADLFNSKFGFEFDVFYEKRDDVLINTSAIIPNEFGIGIGQENAGVFENRGLDFSVYFNHGFSDNFAVSLAANFTYAKNKVIDIAENDATFNDPFRRRTGREYYPDDPTTNADDPFGIKSLGYFQTQAEIDATPWAAALGDVRPGDIKFWDRNEDGVINDADNVVLGRTPFPNSTYGFNVGLNYKKLSLTTFWQGAFGIDTYIGNGFEAVPFSQANGVVFENHLDFWTPDNPNAEFPRLVSNPTGTRNIEVRSTHWIRSADYLRLKTATLSYDLDIIPEIKSLRLYLTGQNLLTFSELFRNNRIDPESVGAFQNYWQQRTITMGLDITF